MAKTLDEITIKRAQRGEQDAVETVLSRCEPLVYHVCLGVLRNREDAFDAAQDALLKIYLNLAKFQFQSAFTSWAYRIAANACLDFIRRNKRHRRAVSQDEIPMEAAWQDTGPGPEESAMDQDRRRMVQDALLSLEERHREVLVLLEYGELSYQEIADVLEIQVGTVKSRIFRARAALAGELKKRELF
jgi:RNA polymerase sigma-70 factor (ECF subfamily)